MCLLECCFDLALQSHTEGSLRLNLARAGRHMCSLMMLQNADIARYGAASGAHMPAFLIRQLQGIVYQSALQLMYEWHSLLACNTAVIVPDMLHDMLEVAHTYSG